MFDPGTLVSGCRRLRCHCLTNFSQNSIATIKCHWTSGRVLEITSSKLPPPNHDFIEFYGSVITAAEDSRFRVAGSYWSYDVAPGYGPQVVAVLSAPPVIPACGTFVLDATGNAELPQLPSSFS